VHLRFSALSGRRWDSTLAHIAPRPYRRAHRLTTPASPLPWGAGPFAWGYFRSVDRGGPAPTMPCWCPTGHHRRPGGGPLLCDAPALRRGNREDRGADRPAGWAGYPDPGGLSEWRPGLGAARSAHPDHQLPRVAAVRGDDAARWAMIDLSRSPKCTRWDRRGPGPARGVATDRAGRVCEHHGPSGSGKSTLMNVLGCLDTPSEGSYACTTRTWAG